MGKGTLPPRETCQGELRLCFSQTWGLVTNCVSCISIMTLSDRRSTIFGDLGQKAAILVNNMANVCAGTSSSPALPQYRRREAITSSDTMGPASRSAEAIAAARASQPQPDVHRARGLALAAARLVEMVSESNEFRMSRLGVDNNNATAPRLGPRQDVVSECEVARLVVAFNIGMLSEVNPCSFGGFLCVLIKWPVATTDVMAQMLGEKVPAREAYGKTRALAKVTLKECDDEELGAVARDAEREASDALDRLTVTEGSG